MPYEGIIRHKDGHINALPLVELDDTDEVELLVGVSSSSCFPHGI